MLIDMMALAQVPGAGALQDLEPNVRLLVIVGIVAAAGAAIYAAATAKHLRMAAGFFLLGLVVAAAAGLALEDAGAAAFAAAVYLVLGASALMYAMPRADGEVGLWGVAAIVGVGALVATTDVKTGAFLTASVLILYSAMKVLQSQILVHATLWLAGVLVGVAGIYLSLGAEFLAVIQILIYVGAVITLFLFTVMLTIPVQEVHGLDALNLPPGVVIESVEDLQEATPRMGAGPYKGFTETNPRKPVRSPPTLYGVSIADGVYGDETTERRKPAKKEEAK